MSNVVSRELQPQLADTVPAVLTVAEVAALLRVNCKTVYDAFARGEIPGGQRVGRVIRFSRDTVMSWLDNGQGRAPRRL